MIEREVKLAAWAGLTLPDLSDVVAGGSVLTLPPQRLQATYYDTPDLRLARWGITVRHRSAGSGEATWTVKLPDRSGGPGLVRQEHNLAGVESRIPPAALHLLRAYVRTATLSPVARLRTDRLRCEVRDAAGQKLLEVDDDEVSVMVPGANGRGRRLATRFREIEAELVPGAPADLLEKVVARLRAAGAQVAEPIPKVVRALGPLAGELPEVVIPAVGPRSTTSEVVRAAIAGGVTRLLQHDPGVRLGDDPEDVHQARVATRRLRSDLRTFRSLLDHDWTVGLREELGWIADLLGEVRDTDVLLERLRTQIASLDAVDARAGAVLLRRLQSEREQARTRLLAGFDSPRYVEVLDRLVAAAAAPALAAPAAAPTAPPAVQPAPWRPAGAWLSGRAPTPPPDTSEAAAELPARKAIPALVRPPWRHLRRAVDALGEAPPDERLHEVRIYAKRCRYAAEAAIPVAGKDARRFATAVAGLQEVLGDLNDTVVAERWLRAQAARGSAAQALVAGQLIAAERAKAVACRAGWARAWRAASAKRLRAWLGE